MTKDEIIAYAQENGAGVTIILLLVGSLEFKGTPDEYNETVDYLEREMYR